MEKAKKVDSWSIWSGRILFFDLEFVHISTKPSNYIFIVLFGAFLPGHYKLCFAVPFALSTRVLTVIAYKKRVLVH
jgi:hypothetical protein